jgi:hypothetical protein
MGKRVSGPRSAEISEPWLMEWFEWGYQHLCAFLANQAKFEEWCLEHHKKGPA